MAKRRRPVSLGTYIMLVLTILTVGMGVWVFTRIAGNIDDIHIDTAALIGALVSTQNPNATEQVAQLPDATPIPSPTPTPIPLGKTVTISVGGQIWLDSTLRKSGAQDDGMFYYDDVFGAITPYMNKADVTMVTLESTVTSAGSYDTYRAPSAILNSLKNAGVDIINLATEHIFDYGKDGLANTRASAEQLGFSVTGANRSAEEQALPLTFEVNGIKIAVLSYTYGLSTAGSKQGTKDDRAIAVGTMDADLIRGNVRSAREQGANLVIVNLHWGKQANTKPNAEQTALVDAIVDCGVDAILGTHPTYVHTMEKRNVNCIDGVNRNVFIAYSLGDFLTNERNESNQIIGTLLNLQFTLDNGSSAVRLTDASYMPTWQMRWQEDKYYFRVLPAGTTSQPSEMTNTVYRNMRRAYEDNLKKLGSDAARPIEE
ncbi:MAG: CapA family protein [Oscillospiraceae bacterium]|jgi:poly-gamma-glutamate synthesis protein (capsule biosynthesis protein)|nr:CapA family protein [Oscillospiraceae bacterium]